MIQKMLNKSLVYPKLNKSGLGNILIIWARAEVFAKINSLELIAPKWNHNRFGSLLRGYSFSRFYQSQFIRNKDYISQLILPFRLLDNQVIKNPELKQYNSQQKTLYIFDKVPYWREYFKELKYFQPYLKERFLSIINPRILNHLDNINYPEVGVHIRRGDLPLKGQISIEWYIRIIELIRELAGYNVSVTIFSDGTDKELKKVLALPNVVRSNSLNWPVYEMLMLSGSKIIVSSASSTFSSWSGFLGQRTIIHYPPKFRTTTLTEENNKIKFEGGFDPENMEIPQKIISDIKKIF